jgi:hypothetical protein
MPADDRSFADFRAAMDHLMDQVAWRVVPRAASVQPGEPYATHEGILQTPMGNIPCFQLNTGERVFDAETVVRLFGLDAEDDLDDGEDAP